MKRDMAMVRKVLESAEDSDPRNPRERSGPAGDYHMWLCAQAGLVVLDRPLDPTTGNLDSRARLIGLTWKGHDLLDTFRNNADALAVYDYKAP